MLRKVFSIVLYVLAAILFVFSVWFAIYWHQSYASGLGGFVSSAGIWAAVPELGLVYLETFALPFFLSVILAALGFLVGRSGGETADFDWLSALDDEDFILADDDLTEEEIITESTIFTEEDADDAEAK
jgi:hypothetical protein